MGIREPRKHAKLRGSSRSQCLALAGSQHHNPSPLSLARAQPGDGGLPITGVQPPAELSCLRQQVLLLPNVVSLSFQ